MTFVTEKEAAERWCPMFRAAIAVGPSDGVEVMTNRDGMQALTSLHNCIGSRCMAWRWQKTHVKIADMSAEDRSQYERLNLVREEDDQELVAAWRTYGFCGAFGKVEP